ncbi:MAG: hypothetical protein ABWZ38_13220 [Candidatus Binatia bacterium]
MQEKHPRQAALVPWEEDTEKNWWDYCPICNSKLLNQKCKYVCSNASCNFFMSCSEFDL